MNNDLQIVYGCVSLILLLMTVVIGYRIMTSIDAVVQILIEQLKVNSSLFNVVAHSRKPEPTFSFPEDPSVGDVFTYQNVEYLFDGVKWVVKSRK